MEKIKLYPYQEDAVSNAVRMLSERGNSLIVAGTGAGKTIMLSSVIGRFFYGFQAAAGRKPHILVLVHRTEIHGQNFKKFSWVYPEIPVSEVTASRKSLHGYVHFGMVQTVCGLLEDFAQAGSFFDLIVIDECHHSAAATYAAIIDWNRRGKPEASLLGVTATPNRGDKVPLIHLFDNFYQITTRFLIDSHYLVRPTFIDCSPEFTLPPKKGKTSGEVLEKGHLSKNCKFDEEGYALIRKLCATYLNKKAPGKSVIFAPSHKFCEAIFAELTRLGRKPAYLSKNIPEDMRKDEIDRFEHGNADELINVDISTEGYDYPPIRNVVDFDTNGTHGQWIQKVGRGLRTCEGKTGCMVLDFGGNIDLYPQGVDTEVNLIGVVKNPREQHLSEEDLFRSHEANDKSTAEYQENPSGYEFTPYNPPQGFETVSDKHYGVVFVSCGSVHDCIILKAQGTDNTYHVFLGDKKELFAHDSGTFDDCVKKGMAWCGAIEADPARTISRLQTRLLAPEFATSALTWYGANCCICWKTWRGMIRKMTEEILNARPLA